jgi:hypothetical protein
MISQLRKAGLDISTIGGVFGAPYSSILLAGDIGRLINRPVYVPQKDPKDPNGKKMIFKSDDPIPENSILLQIEELVTTFDSGDATKEAISAGNPFPVKFTDQVAVLIHRPPSMNRELPDGRRIIPFIEMVVNAWDPAVCPLCRDGSVPLPPKGENWALLTA